ncbi:MAG: hypothetical protein Q7S74_03445 [Nanoarchaeota archaeon]|nr:hypothetical protein [Nanoarchaeota archaeon]
MVWQYEESYPDYPYLSDWAGKEFKFGIGMSDSIVGEKLLGEAELHGHTMEVTETQTDGILKPSFYFMGNKTDRPYQLQLSLLGGLTRRVYSTIDEGQIGGYKSIELYTRKLGLGGFEDFKAIANYAIKRLPKIAQEITLLPTNFPNDIPEDRIESILKYRDQCLGVLDWETTQKEISKEFCSLFGTFILAVKGEPGVELIPRRGDDRFTFDQIKELTDLIERLR